MLHACTTIIGLSAEQGHALMLHVLRPPLAAPLIPAEPILHWLA